MNQDLLRVFETESDYDSAKPDFIYPTISYVRDVDEVYYMTKPVIPLYFEALNDGFTVLFNDGDLEYSLDGGSSWETLVAGEESPSINAGERIYLQGQLDLPVNYSPYNAGVGTFILSQECNVGGNVMSLISYADTLGESEGALATLFQDTPIVDASELILPAIELPSHCYYSMFYGCTSLTTAPRILPATTLTNYCYEMMFRDCPNLTTTPELPATTLARYCYNFMFAGCTSLVTAPELPATTVVDYCYTGMFRDCTNLNYIKMLATDMTINGCLYQWVDGVSSTGTFVKNPALSEDTIGRGISGIPEGWIVVDAE